MVGIQIGKEQEERKREEEGLNFETTPWWNFRNHHGLCGRRAAEREFVKIAGSTHGEGEDHMTREVYHMTRGVYHIH